MAGKRIGYIRVSTTDQNVARQLDADELAAKGIILDVVFTDRCSGRDMRRPELQRCLQYLRGGDTLYVHSIDRLARNLNDLQRIIEELNGRDVDTVGEGVSVVFIKNNLMFSGKENATPADKLMLHMLGAFSEFEREIIKERQREGIAKAKAAGKYTGKKSKLTVDDLDAMQALKDAGVPVAEIGRKYGGMTRQGVYKALRRRGDAVSECPAEASKDESEQAAGVVVPSEVGGVSAETVEKQLIVDTSSAVVELRAEVLPVVQNGSVLEAVEAVRQDTLRVAEQELVVPEAKIDEQVSIIDTSPAPASAETQSAQTEPDAVRQDEPEHLKTTEECLEAVKKNVMALEFVPNEFLDENFCLEAVKYSYGHALHYMPKALKTPKLCMESVKQLAEALEWVPEDMKTPELCMEAVRTDGIALLFVPKDLITEELCRVACASYGWILSYVPKRLRTLEVCMTAVGADGRGVYVYVPKKFWTTKERDCMADIYMEGVRHSFDLKDVPKKFQTPKLCMEAVKRKGIALAYVPEKLKTPELCVEAVKQNAYALGSVPEQLKTPELCMVAVKRDGEALEFVPEQLKTPELCMEAVKQCGKALEFVPEKLKAKMAVNW